MWKVRSGVDVSPYFAARIELRQPMSCTVASSRYEDDHDDQGDDIEGRAGTVDARDPSCRERCHAAMDHHEEYCQQEGLTWPSAWSCIYHQGPFVATVLPMGTHLIVRRHIFRVLNTSCSQYHGSRPVIYARCTSDLGEPVAPAGDPSSQWSPSTPVSITPTSQSLNLNTTHPGGAKQAAA